MVALELYYLFFFWIAPGLSQRVGVQDNYGRVRSGRGVEDNGIIIIARWKFMWSLNWIIKQGTGKRYGRVNSANNC